MPGKKPKKEATPPSQTITILIFGDVVSKLGRRTVQHVLPEWQKKYKPDLVVANVENLAHGRGVTEKTLSELSAAGITAFTGGNHIWAKNNPFEPAIANNFLLATPANDSRATTSTPWISVALGDLTVYILNLQGQVFMADDVENPFHSFDALYKKMNGPKLLLVDFHAEATSEKVALSFHCDGRASVVYGTHTHIPTADARIREGGTGYISDIGMTGSDDSVLGVDKSVIVKRFLGIEKGVFDYPETGPALANALLATIDTQTGKCTALEHLQKKVIL